MPTIEQLQKLAEAGPFVFVAALLAAHLVLDVVAMARKWIVFGWMFDREAKRADDGQAAGKEAISAVTSLTDEVRWYRQAAAPARPRTSRRTTPGG